MSPNSREQRAIAHHISKLGACPGIDYYRAHRYLYAYGKRALPQLLVCANSARREERWVAAYMLGKSGEACVIPTLLTLASDRDLDVQYDAINALGQIGCLEVLPDLLEIARKECHKESLAGVVAGSLGDYGDEALPFIQLLLHSKDPDARHIAIWSLRRVGSDRAVELLKRAAKDRSSTVRKWALDALEDVMEVDVSGSGK